MKKWHCYILTTAVIVAVAIPIYWEAQTCEARANQCISSFMAARKLNQANPPIEAIQACRESQCYFCRVLAPANLPNVVLCLVGVGAVLAALFTLGAIKRQSDATIRSERAYIIAELVPICFRVAGQLCRPSGDSYAPLSQDEILDGYHLSQRLHLTNMGRTPATILTCKISCTDFSGKEAYSIEVPNVIRAMGGSESQI